jgi:ABC-type transport system involved in multi-copper enzyme maturation permease subunit
MKFLAILKDSLREAIDTKIFAIMVGLSVLCILFLFSFTFRPVDAEEEVRRTTEDLSWQFERQARAQEEARRQAATDATDDGAPGRPRRGTPRQTPPRVDLESFRKVGGGEEPWAGEYNFRIVLRYGTAEELQMFDIIFGKSGVDLIRSMLRSEIPWMDNPTVTRVPSDDPRAAVYQVNTKTSVTSADDWPYEPAVFFGLWKWSAIHTPRRTIIEVVMGLIVNYMGAALALLLSTVVTAFFIPNMLRKGTVDMLVVKPIHRSTLLVYKYLGGLMFMFLNTAVIVLGVYLVIGVRIGYWVNGFLLSTFVLTFEFAIYYSFSALWGVLTRSPIVSILLTCALWLVLFVVGQAYVIVEGIRKQEGPGADRMPKALTVTVDTVHFVLPRITDLDVLNRKLVMDSLPGDETGRRERRKLFESFNWTENIAVNLAFIGVMLGLACWRFTSRDI